MNVFINISIIYIIASKFKIYHAKYIRVNILFDTLTVFNYNKIICGIK